MFRPTNVLCPRPPLVSELISYHRCKIYFNYQDEQLRGQPITPLVLIQRGPPGAPCQYFQLSVALAFPVAGVLISCATGGATGRFPGPPTPPPSPPPGYSHGHTPLPRISRCRGVAIQVPLEATEAGGPHKHTSIPNAPSVSLAWGGTGGSSCRRGGRKLHRGQEEEGKETTEFGLSPPARRQHNPHAVWGRLGPSGAAGAGAGTASPGREDPRCAGCSTGARSQRCYVEFDSAKKHFVLN